MKILVAIVGALLALFGAAYVFGLTIPATQKHTRTITLKQPPEAVFKVVADVQNMPKWNQSVEKVEPLPPIDGKEATRQTFKGNLQMTIVTRESNPPHHLVRSMGDADGPFVGSWIYAISPARNGSTVALTEESQVKNPITRLMMKVFGPTRYIDEHLRDLASHFGETAVIR